ncbi:MAG: nucleoside-diphosphate kinase [Bacteroidetes bacterium HGW-Bacteroidetes-9]|jgi:nucleoside-diphosphate kinase|nr:MAG: nucleoside-diphosphate kinase [Bacteroidetes bacterium HGW-Bacteroidetes-9]
MTGNITFTMIKPAAYQNQYAGKILDMILNKGFRISAIKIVKLTRERAAKFYEVHKDRPFYNDLVEFMSSGEILAAILEKENAVDDYRALIGSTNPADAADGTIRKVFGESVQKNAVHGSDSDENAIKEAAFFFSELERY